MTVPEPFSCSPWVGLTLESMSSTMPRGGLRREVSLQLRSCLRRGGKAAHGRAASPSQMGQPQDHYDGHQHQDAKGDWQSVAPRKRS
jgi:hypothetical protein